MLGDAALMSAPTDLPAVSLPLPWQSGAWERLNRQMAQSSLPHALLLSGPQHSGKQRFATALARRILCERPGDGLNCGNCHACEMSAAGTHSDFRWLGPEGKSLTIKVDSVRQTVAFAGKTASHGRGKVIVFSPAEALNVNAANALLKCLEEPPPGTYLLLLAAQPYRIAPTLRSRCQQLRLPLPGSEESLNWLDGTTGSRPESEKWLELASGLPMLAADLFTAPDAEAQVASRVACSALLAGKVTVREAVAMLEPAALSQVLEQLAAVLRAHIRNAGDDWLRSRRGRAVFALLDEVLQAQRAVHSGANPNRQLMCEVFLEKLHFLLGTAQPGASIGA